MRLTIDSKTCKDNNITLDEFLVLYLNARGAHIKNLMESIIQKGIAGRDLFNENALVLSNNAKSFVERIIADSNFNVQSNMERIKELAKTLQSIYIPGKKPGTQDYFRCTSTQVIDKLKKFFMEHSEYTDEQIIEATKKYISSFNGDYTYAQLLKYFIGKQTEDGKGSRLLMYLENADQKDPNQLEIDWDVELK